MLRCYLVLKQLVIPPEIDGSDNCYTGVVLFRLSQLDLMDDWLSKQRREG